jgi:hypothetical protein
VSEYPYTVFIEWREGDNRPGLEEWLQENCPGEWDSLLYCNPATLLSDRTLFLFKSKEVALRFKLSWG